MSGINIRGRNRLIRRCAVIAAGLTIAGCSASVHSSSQVMTQTSTSTTSTAPQSTTATSPATTATSPSTSSATSTSSTAPAKAASITVVMNGDVLLHTGLWDSARIAAEREGRGGMDYRPIIADMRPVVSAADLAICHLETPLAPRGGPYTSYPVFSVPPQILPALKWEGYDACTTMSNHTLDDGFDGIVRTLDDFDRVGIAHFGSASTKKESRTPLILDVKGVHVALIGATYGTNGIPIPSAEPWCVPIINVAKIEAMAAKARRMGADIVIVALHWGDEYVHTPSSYQVQIADQLTKDKDISLIYGHHAHVVQPYDKIHGTWVIYGLGNAIAQQDASVEGVYDGNTARVTFSQTPDGSYKVSKLEYIPTMITQFDGADPMRWLDVPAALHGSTYAALRPDLLATQERVKEVVGSLGAFRHGVTEGR